MEKESSNPLREKGRFDSKAQVRLLLHFYRQNPEKYKWVLKLLSQAGMPETEKIPDSRCYWAPDYNPSPDTPSYVYTGGGYKKKKEEKASVYIKMIKFAEKLEDEGYHLLEEKLIEAIEEDGEV
jgi:hypothetical protein